MSARQAVNWDYVISEAEGWIESLCECGHPEDCHVPLPPTAASLGEWRHGACGEKDCYGTGARCTKFRRVQLKVVRG